MLPSRWDVPALLLLLSFTSLARSQPAAIKPGPPVDGRKIVFDPDKWNEKHVSMQLVPWNGQHIAFLTTKADLDGAVMARFLDRIDGGWQVYANLVDRKPNLFKQLDGKPTIVAVPDGALTCGAGCGFIGASGIEVAMFYDHDYPLVKARRNAFPHYYFYEMGRNFYLFGNRHSQFITGYAVFMRYVCMDQLHCEDDDAATRATIERAEAMYAESSDLTFLGAFTNVAGLDEKRPRLKNARGDWVQPSDQPVMYASAMLKLRRDCGGDAWLKRFFEELQRCPEVLGARQARRPAAVVALVHRRLVRSPARSGRDLRRSLAASGQHPGQKGDRGASLEDRRPARRRSRRASPQGSFRGRLLVAQPRKPAQPESSANSIQAIRCPGSITQA